VDWIPAKAISEACPGELGVSREGTLGAAVVQPVGGESLIVASMYAPWEKPHGTAKAAGSMQMLLFIGPYLTCRLLSGRRGIVFSSLAT
jgi:hypothetical protein